MLSTGLEDDLVRVCVGIIDEDGVEGSCELADELPADVAVFWVSLVVAAVLLLLLLLLDGNEEVRFDRFGRRDIRSK